MKKLSLKHLYNFKYLFYWFSLFCYYNPLWVLVLLKNNGHISEDKQYLLQSILKPLSNIVTMTKLSSNMYPANCLDGLNMKPNIT
ncbi:hypothetical protein MAR_029558 [Mya arenaria]|uniref:Uncharacterized protein n=1 Tax=Mya arenaria TaxID=6604 RepID=A0ABY7DLA9_MYAAR|nr:hypothetical protein MAR_029558 [Mya arenaria]